MFILFFKSHVDYLKIFLTSQKVTFDIMKTIAVHSSTFHADDCLAIYLLLNTTEFENSVIIRTRDQDTIDKCDAVVDVGGIYDNLLHRYDHHQKTFTDRFPNSEITMASSGLVYLHFGEEAIKKICKKLKLELNEESLDFVYNYMYFHFVQEIDAQDNGISQSNEKPSFQISSSISSRISRLNPHWKTENPDIDKFFRKGVDLMGKDFDFFLTYTVNCAVKNFEMTKAAYESRFDFDPSGKFLNVPKYFPVNDFLEFLEGDEKTLLYLIYSKTDETHGEVWTIRTITTDKPFESRKPLPYPGVDAQKMEELTGIEGLIFAHKSPFLAVFQTKEQVLQYAHFAADFIPPKEKKGKSNTGGKKP